MGTFIDSSDESPYMEGNDPLSESLEAVHGIEADPQDVLRALATPRCRYLLALLDEKGRRMTIDEAAASTAGWEFDCDPEEAPEETVERLVISIYHVQAPKLDEADLVDFDPDELAVTISDVGAELEGSEFLPTIE